MKSGTRLVDRHRDGSWRGSLRNRMELSQARAVDWLLAMSGTSSPTLLVSGFMRSGTTWVQECLAASLGAKTVFEPLSPLEPGRRAAMADDGTKGESTAQGTIPGPWPEDDPAWAYLGRACRGGNASRFSMTCRRGRRESSSRMIVVKDVRLQFNLDAFHARFDVPVLHVTRHPCAVVASLSRAEWGWGYDRLTLGDVLPTSDEVWRSGAMGRDDIVRRFDGDAVSRIAALWAVSERFAGRSLAGRPWARQVAYESLVADPVPAFADLRTWLGVAADRPCDFGRPSASSHRAGAASGGLTERERSRVLTAVEAIHPGWDARRAAA